MPPTYPTQTNPKVSSVVLDAYFCAALALRVAHALLAALIRTWARARRVFHAFCAGVFTVFVLVAILLFPFLDNAARYVTAGCLLVGSDSPLRCSCHHILERCLVCFLVDDYTGECNCVRLFSSGLLTAWVKVMAICY